MTEEKALVPTHQSALDVYGSGEDIKTLSQRIKLCLPGGNKLQDHDALALAQLSVAYGLNPFNGEVWVIVDKQGVSRGTMVGIKGLRKAARRQGNYWPVFDVLTNAEKQELCIPEHAVAYRCKVYRTDVLREAAESIDLLTKVGMKNAFEIYAYKPAEGIGYATQDEVSKMKIDQRARKRAESDALKVAFDLPFATEITGGGEAIGYVDTEWEVQGVEQKLTGEPLQQKLAENIKALRGDESDLGDELEDYLDAEITPEIPDFPHDPSGFFGAVNKHTNYRYKSVQELTAKFKEELNMTKWPRREDNQAWDDLWLSAVGEDTPF